MSNKNKKENQEFEEILEELSAENAEGKSSDEPLSEEEMSQRVKDEAGFEQDFLTSLSGTENMEIIPTMDENGETLDAKQLQLIKQECTRMGLKVIYRIDYSNKIVLFNPEDMKTGVITEDIH